MIDDLSYKGILIQRAQAWWDLDILTTFMKTVLLLVVLLAATQQTRFSQSLKQWTFRYEGAGRDYPATIPSSLAWDLIDNKLVSSDPYYRDNFLQFYEFETKDASYRTSFNITPTVLASKHQYLVFEGLDTHAEVYLNGQHILSAHNMFRRYEVEVKFNRTNDLVVNFTASTKHDIEQERIFKETYGFGLPANYSFTRKAAYQYGWDWGPRILSVGIWKEVFAVLYNDTRVDNLRFTHSEITKTTKSISCQVGLDVSHLDQLASYSLSLLVRRKATNTPIYETVLPIKATTSTSLSLPFNITSNIWDHVWWTWDLGQPNLITVSVKLVNLNSLESFESSITTGIRSIGVVQEFSKTYNGTSFTFNLNGYDVYMRGGNYIPAEMSLARTNKATYEKIKEYALFGRFNMIRLWGGGQFEKNEFYESMDEAGILIWHDLMFACALYPSSTEILANIEAEMRDNVRRVRHHPSIGLWNGNNEVWIGWQEWGWQKGLTDNQKKQVEQMYADVFRGVLPKVLKEEHAEVYYWETSPSVSSSSTKNLTSGDIHFWRVWAAGAPIEEYEEYVGRFNSEYGMQAMPEMSTLQRFTRPEDLDYPSSNDSYVMRLHERHPSGHILLPGYTFNYSCATGNTTLISYFSQVMQSYALEMAISTLRLNKPFNMGSLYWQLNDVWPVTSWATVDYYGSYKAAHYKVRSVYEQLIIHTIHDKSTGDYVTYVVNDYNKTFSCHCTVAIITFAGEATKVKHTVEKTVKPFERALIHRFNKTEYSNFTHTGFIRMDLRTLDNVVSANNYFFVPMKNRTNALPGLTYSFQGNSLVITTQKIASYVWIYRKANGNFLPLQLADNYFTLIPGESRTLEVGNTPHGEIYVSCYEIEFNSVKGTKSLLTE